MKNLFLSSALFLALLALSCAPAGAQPATNLVPNASFEAAPAWFDENGASQYRLGKSQIADAPDGAQVLELSAWNEGARVLSPTFDIPGGTLSATVAVRAFDVPEGGKISLALFDATGKKLIGTFGQVAFGDAAKWTALTSTVEAPAGKVRLALLPSGEGENGVIQLDKLGLFAGPAPGAVVNNADWEVVEAESLATGKAWTARPHFKGWYTDVPSGEAMLAGSDGVAPADNGPAIATMTAKNEGSHVLWIRMLFAAGRTSAFTVTVEQGGQAVAARTIDSGDTSLSPENRRLHWIWVPIEATLKAGQVQVRLTRPNKASTRLARNIDLLLLTNAIGYKPSVTDLRPQLYLRWTNTGTGQPYCLWTYIHRNRAPWFANAGMLGKIGFNRAYRVDRDPDKWIGPGQSSQWSNISSYLLQDGAFNRVQFTATRKGHTEGYVEGPIQGTLEFALGPEKKIIKTIPFKQDAPRLRVAVPGDLSKPDLAIRTGYDFLADERKAIGTAPVAKPAKYLDLVTFLELDRGVDDPVLIQEELKNFTDMGFNGTYYALTDPKSPQTTLDPYRAHGMQAHLGIGGGTWYPMEDRDFTRPDLAGIDRKYQLAAKNNAAILPNVVRMKTVDEPRGQTQASIAKSPSAQQRFRQYLQSLKLTPADLGAADWEGISTVAATDKAVHPALFYYSELFRLQLAAEHAKLLVTEKKKYLPDNVKTYANYSPPLSWVERGVDPFLTQRNGGLEMGWSEDWLAFYAGPEYTSDTYALLRAAGQGQPLGGYMVGASGGPLLQRIKYYTMVASGARQIGVYSYGPAYADIDSWSEKYDIYLVLRAVNAELGSIDEALHGTTRRAAQIAILYNRTAAIWGGEDSTSELDARFIRWALSHAGYDADIIPEEDIAAGKLDGYKVLYIDGIQLRRDAAQKVAAWVQNGGVLFGAAGAATRDEFNRPSTALETVFGARSENLQPLNPAGRPKYELRTQPALAALKPEAPEVGAAQFDQLCYRETLQPLPGATVLFKNAAGAAMGTRNTAGKGTAFRLAALPGLAYLNHATRDEKYNPNSYLPRDFDAAQREFLALPARIAKVAPVAQCDLGSSEIVRYDAPGRSVLFVINYAGEAKPGFSMLVPDAAWATTARAADGAHVTLQKETDGAVRLTFPLNVAGAVVLEK